MRSAHLKEPPRRGQALVEFVLFVTLLLLVIGGVVDVGRVLLYHIALNDAVQDGAAYGALYPADTTGIEARVRDSVRNLTDRALNVSVEYIGSPCAGNGIRVQAAAEVSLIFPMSRVIFPSGRVAVSTVSTQTILHPACPPSP